MAGSVQERTTGTLPSLGATDLHDPWGGVVLVQTAWLRDRQILADIIDPIRLF